MTSKRSCFDDGKDELGIVSVGGGIGSFMLVVVDILGMRGINWSFGALELRIQDVILRIMDLFDSDKAYYHYRTKHRVERYINKMSQGTKGCDLASCSCGERNISNISRALIGHCG